MFRIIVLSTILTLSCILVSAEFYTNCKTGKYFQSGSSKPLAGGELQEAEHELRMILVRLAEGEGPFYRVAVVYGGTQQIVEGSLKTLNAELIDFNNMKHDCELDIWFRPWLADVGTEVTIRCECMRTVVVRHVEQSI